MVDDPEISLRDLSEAPSPARSFHEGSSVAPQAGVLQVDSLASECQILKQKGCCDRVIDTVLLKRKPVTREIYGTPFAHGAK